MFLLSLASNLRSSYLDLLSCWHYTYALLMGTVSLTSQVSSMVATENRNCAPLLLGRCGWEVLDSVLCHKGTEPTRFLICETGLVTACPQSNKTPFSMNVCSVSSSGTAFVHTDYITGQEKRRSLALVGMKALGQTRGYGAQFSLGRAGTLARTDSKRVYMSIPRRNTVSCNRSSWSCSSTGVRFMGEKPRAGIPTARR